MQIQSEFKTLILSYAFKLTQQSMLAQVNEDFTIFGGLFAHSICSLVAWGVLCSRLYSLTQLRYIYIWAKFNLLTSKSDFLDIGGIISQQAPTSFKT